MFDNFSNKISGIFDKIARRRFISEDDLKESMREIRIALLEADVSLVVVKDFIAKIQEIAIGHEVFKSVSPGQMIVKIVHDELVNLLGSTKSEINIDTKPPAIILAAGLQASGKTTSCAKLANLLKRKDKRILLASLDIYRPAAAEQLQILAQQLQIDCADFDPSKSPLELAKSAKKRAIEYSYDILILDSAGRNVLDKKMMQEVTEIEREINPVETLLVVDSMIGQEGVNVANSFKESLNLTGIILTRLDGDSRGGAALTMKAVTGCPIKFIGVGEKIDDFEEFNPDRIASRIFGMGDVVTLVEKAKDFLDEEKAEKTARKLAKGQFDFNDLLSQIKNMKKMGGIAKIAKMLPGMSKIQEQIDARGGLDKEIKLQEAIILSMTKQERAKPDLLNSSRKRRIALGSGATIQQLNSLLKKYKQMQKMLRKVGGKDPAEIEGMLKQFSNSKTPNFGNIVNINK
jgi:signal recognition particle subunit SRP54